MIKSSRFIALMMLTAGAVVANAQSFYAASLGTYDNSFGPYYTTSEAVISELDPWANPTTLDFYAVYGGAGISSGTATYDDGMGNTLVLDITGGPFSIATSSLTSSVAGNWTFLSGTGAYASIASGVGTWSASYSASLGALSQTTFVGDFEPVPEPASMAALALGIGALVARRRRK
jgi:hypothetical protein